MSGRPSSFTQELAGKICDRIAEGDSLRKICEDDDMPDRTTVRRWLSQDEEFRLQYAGAREDQSDFYADQIIDLADDKKALDPHKTRLQIDARKWIASKLKPKVYGDRIQQDLTINELDGLTGSQIDGRLAAIEAAISAEAGEASATDGEEPQA